MAKITAEFDTVTKKMVVAMDGVPFTNVTSVSFYNYDGDDQDGKFYAEVATREISEEGDMAKYTRVCASDKGEAEVTERVENTRAQALGKLLFKKG